MHTQENNVKWNIWFTDEEFDLKCLRSKKPGK